MNLDPKDPLVPAFWKGSVEDVYACVGKVIKGKVETIARSAGGRKVHLVSYGQTRDLKSQANYGSACGAGNPAWFASKPKDMPPAVFFVGPVHGQEIGGIVGMVNLISIAKTGRDLRGRAWPGISEAFKKCRVLIVPLANPDGRARCPYNSFVGIDTKIMAHCGQGSRADGTDYGWPGVKTRQPMIGDVGFLGCYHNDAGINMAHDDFFVNPAPETRALLDVAKREATDYIAALHSHGGAPLVLPCGFLPNDLREKFVMFSAQYSERMKNEGVEVKKFKGVGTGRTFYLNSALHHVSGGLPLLFECPQGLSKDNYQATHEQILDFQLQFYEEVLKFAIANPVIWER